MIQCVNLTKRYAKREVIKDLSFSIADGEFVCFSGKSGSGKTTLLNMIGLLEEPTSGRILFDGKEIRGGRARIDFYRNRVGFIFQNFALVEGKTVAQNLNLVKKNCRQDGITVEEALSQVGMEEKLYSKVYTLSGGEQQRVALARLYLKKCDIILADEPTGSLDQENAAMVMGILRKLNAKNKTVIIVTHDDEIKRQCDRILSLS
ncbi:ABC transporter ATP-binding protein [Evtepia sp.]|uniref:ABC transporter ATP-binding protein n=1 Tax=Evtepia sp. TaxID=2773933 RepID=UPI002E79704E|nr:ABC transporter ATP-binding protein [Evtepia sp.]MEE0749107.1 ABC transporter ATP-binding protein [Evtepia sp.]